RAAEAAVRLAPREGAFLLLADIEEAETGDQGRVRHWLAKAVRAPRDPAWVADGFVSERWMPASPVTGQLDAFEWRVPVERLGQVLEGEEALALPAIEAEPREEKTASGSEDVVPEETVVTVEAEPALEATETPREAEAPLEPEAQPEPEIDEEKPAEPEEPPKERGKAAAPPNGDGENEEAVPPRKRSEEARPPLPDDPGVEPEDAERQASSRFRLF
ncbi:heme biosynthesis protein HemY, partial [Nitratireductor sp. GCM10026969]